MVKHDSFVGSFGQNWRSTHFLDGMGLPFGQSLATSVTEVPNGHSSSEMHAKDMPPVICSSLKPWVSVLLSVVPKGSVLLWPPLIQRICLVPLPAYMSKFVSGVKYTNTKPSTGRVGKPSIPNAHFCVQRACSTHLGLHECLIDGTNRHPLPCSALWLLHEVSDVSVKSGDFAKPRRKNANMKGPTCFVPTSTKNGCSL